MKYVRVRDKSSGHEFSEPADSPLIKKGTVEVVSRKPATTLPLPPKFNVLSKKSPAGGEKKEASNG